MTVRLSLFVADSRWLSSLLSYRPFAFRRCRLRVLGRLRVLPVERFSLLLLRVQPSIVLLTKLLFGQYGSLLGLFRILRHVLV